jgi:glycine hydroxymethyltransferase
MGKIVDLIEQVFPNFQNEAKLAEIKEEVNKWMVSFPLYK